MHVVSTEKGKIMRISKKDNYISKKKSGKNTNAIQVKKNVMKNKHRGSNFDEFLEAEGLRAETEATAIKRVIAFQFEQQMKKSKRF